MQIERLRLVGFKSFVDAAELAIEPGLTGIVGPNGCGKSNLVEALRWVMGETSARRLRGGEMDDVIFAGSAGRPARNIAEVALTLDDAGGSPSLFGERSQNEVVRRIERGGGSSYRINGREVRARDVQLLFADAASGAHSAALVTQGRVGALIDARPGERRLLLEEAAGVAGLQARRRESELRLDAAAANLARLDDVVATMTAQLETLKKQARQAARYRQLAEHIRRAEALLLRARWLAAEAETARLDADLRAAERDVAAATEQSLVEGRARDAAETDLPPLRLAAAASEAELQRLTRAREGLEAELARVLAARAEAERRLAQLAADSARESGHVDDAAAALRRLAAEQQALEEAERDAAPAGAAAARLADGEARLAAAETTLQRATEAAAEAAARRAGLDREVRDLAERLRRLESRRGEAERQRAGLATALVPAAATAAAAAAVADAAARADQERAAIEAAEHDLAARLADEAAAREEAGAAAALLARLQAEMAGLTALLAAPDPDRGGRPAALDSLLVSDGFEAAIGAVFADTLAAPLDDGAGAASQFWLTLPTLAGPPMPAGARPLAGAVGAPPALGRRLALAGWVEDAAEGDRLQPLLAPGQRLVDKSGRLWRWDGFTRRAPDASAAARQLQQKKRRTALDGEIATASAAAPRRAAAAAAAHAQWQQAAAADRQARARLRESEAALAAGRAVAAELAQRGLATETRLAAVADLLDKLAGETAAAEAQAAAAERDRAALPDDAAARANLDRARIAATAARAEAAEARAARDRLDRDIAARRERLAAVAREAAAWTDRRDGAVAQSRVLAERREAAATEIAGLAVRPAAIAADAEALRQAIAERAGEARAAADRLALGETRLRACQEAARLADRLVAEAREQRARLSGLCDGARDALARLSREISERLDTAPAGLAELAGIDAAAPAPDPTETAARLERLLAEREAMGPVNLVAESEAQQVAARIDGLTGERAELTEAIARLRRGIAALDQEGRERLVDALERVGAHFGQLFQKLFGGGKARLELVGDADPLAAGLEIVASPPGKRPQLLSLLSGGEQALTALALIFAVFLTNPAPVCVLDEVDAPLDDANVDRFCGLVGDIADAAGTRFLIVTHHRITMARVDRLFGVTMAERGVSQLVSVDLARAAQLRQTA